MRNTTYQFPYQVSEGPFVNNRALAIVCRRIKTEVMTTANQKIEEYYNRPVKTQTKDEKTAYAQEFTSDQVLRCTFASDWIKKWRKFSGRTVTRTVTRRKKQGSPLLPLTLA